MFEKEAVFMKKMLITGGTVFVSRYAAECYRDKYEVYVLNRNTRPNCTGVTVLEGDRHKLGDLLKGLHFDVVLDITAYTDGDVGDLLDGLGSFGDYILISSSAVYPETEKQPFTEQTATGPNRIWGQYGTDKIAAERRLLSRIPGAYILRPPYLYGPMNNVYREAFVFDCALQDRPFFLPGDGSMKLQFFYVGDLFRFADVLLEHHPEQHVFNVGNRESVTIRDWVTACYQALGKTPVFRSVDLDIPQRQYFPFYNYAYSLEVSEQSRWMPETKSLEDGLRESWQWYRCHPDLVSRKPMLEYVDAHLT